MGELYALGAEGRYRPRLPSGRGVRRLWVAMAGALVVAIVFVVFLGHGHTAGGDRDQQTMLTLYQRYGITQPGKHPSFDTSSDVVSRDVPFDHSGVAELCTVTTGPTPDDVTASCHEAH